MNCISCNCTHNDRPLFRTKPVGQPDGGWMCMPCLDNLEPELAKNTREDMSQLEKDLFPELLKKAQIKHY